MSNNKPKISITSKVNKVLLTILLLFTFSYTAFSGITYNGDNATIESGHEFEGETIIEGNLTIKGELKVTIKQDATLIVKGDIIMRAGKNNKTRIDAFDGAELIVVGNINAANDVEIILRKGSKTVLGGNLSFTHEGTNVSINRTLDDVAYNPPLYILGTYPSGITIIAVNVYGETELKNEDEDFKNRVSVALPITLINFEATTFSDYNHLQWATASESNNDYFTIYKSTDGVNWQWFAEKSSVNGNSSIRTDYEFIDNNVKHGITYYKLEQTDFDGTTETSKVIAVEKVLTENGFVISKNNIKVLFSNPNETQIVTITSLRGSVFYKKSFTSVYDAFIETNNLTKGVYVVSLYTPSGITSQTFIK